MKITLSSNLPIQLSSETDAFGTIKKADAIKSFLETTDLKNNKMFVLYGAWGSGKTTIMDYLLDNLDPNKYKGIKFEAWKYEKDDNLIFSLIDYLVEKTGISGKEIAKEFINTAFVVLKGFAKGITFQVPGLSLDASKLFENLEEAQKKEESKPISFYKMNKKLQDLFLKVEKEILGKAEIEKGKRTIVFIDDLDRCEPENILNLLSALKLFFTYGNNTIFFCGIDKKAVQQAVKTKYSGVIKSEAYLEKVFDLSFNMPLTFDAEIMLKNYFPGKIDDTNSHASFFSRFLKQIGFTTPRHIKKLLNKYDILRSFKNNESVSQVYQALIPDILTENSGNHVETLFTLYMIVLFEFYPEKFNEIKRFGKKTHLYANLYIEANEGKGKQSTRIEGAYDFVEKRIGIRGKSLQQIKVVFNDNKKNNVFGGTELLNDLSLMFTPINISAFNFYDKNYRHHLKQFESKENTVLVNFCYFLGENQNLIFETDDKLTPDYPIYKYFEMVETLL